VRGAALNGQPLSDLKLHWAQLLGGTLELDMSDTPG
jgi:putative alpha-1,2-mannosidase